MSAYLDKVFIFPGDDCTTLSSIESIPADVISSVIAENTTRTINTPNTH